MDNAHTRTRSALSIPPLHFKSSCLLNRLRWNNFYSLYYPLLARIPYTVTTFPNCLVPTVNVTPNLLEQHQLNEQSLNFFQDYSVAVISPQMSSVSTATRLTEPLPLDAFPFDATHTMEVYNWFNHISRSDNISCNYNSPNLWISNSMMFPAKVVNIVSKDTHVPEIIVPFVSNKTPLWDSSDEHLKDEAKVSVFNCADTKDIRESSGFELKLNSFGSSGYGDSVRIVSPIAPILIGSAVGGVETTALQKDKDPASAEIRLAHIGSHDYSTIVKETSDPNFLSCDCGSTTTATPLSVRSFLDSETGGENSIGFRSSDTDTLQTSAERFRWTNGATMVDESRIRLQTPLQCTSDENFSNLRKTDPGSASILEKKEIERLSIPETARQGLFLPGIANRNLIIPGIGRQEYYYEYEQSGFNESEEAVSESPAAPRIVVSFAEPLVTQYNEYPAAQYEDEQGIVADCASLFIDATTPHMRASRDEGTGREGLALRQGTCCDSTAEDNDDSCIQADPFVSVLPIPRRRWQESVPEGCAHHECSVMGTENLTSLSSLKGDRRFSEKGLDTRGSATNA